MSEVDHIRERLIICAEQMEAGIAAFRQRHTEGQSYCDPEIPVESLLDTNGRPILPVLYAELAQVYRALLDLEEARA